MQRLTKKLDSEHAEIFNALDHLYSASKKHWDTEEAMFQEGFAKQPMNHQNVQQEYKTHIAEHKALLDEISAMRDNIVKHINDKDLSHFHWTK